jgi:exodeoxyribonuclease V beta subunit
LYFGEEIYRYNFFSLIESEVKPIAKVDFNRVSLLNIVKKVISEYELFNGDFHLIRFLDVLAKQTNIEALLFEYERIDASAAASDLSGVRVLTVHKSKGLEYEHVIVMDRLKKAPPSRDAFIDEYEGIHLLNVYLRMSGRETLDKEYENAINKEKILEREDNLNALYVAFTRAKENLFIVAKPKDSMFDILDLTASKRGTLVCKKTQHIEQKALKTLEYKELYYGMQSDLLELQKEKEEDLQAINFGLGLHYMLEMLAAFEPQNIEDAKNALINKYGYILEESEIEDIIQRVSRLLEETAFRELIQGECYRE